MKIIFYAIVTFLLCFMVQNDAYAAQDTCQIVARLFDKDICYETIKENRPSYLMDPALPADIKEKTEQDLLRREQNNLENLIWQKSLNTKFPDTLFEPSPDVLDSFRNKFKSSIANSYETDKKTVILLEDELKSNMYTDKDKAQLADLLQAVKMSVHFYEQRQDHKANMPKDFNFVADEAERQITLSMLQQWIIDKTLFDFYGDTLVFKQDSLWPIEGYRQFLSYIKTDGSLSIKDPAYQYIFSELKSNLMADYEIIPTDSELYNNYFSTPEWQFKLANNETRLDDLKKWLESLKNSKNNADN